MPTLVDNFFNQWNGKACEVESPENKNQCFDLALAYMDFLSVPREAIRHLYAYQIETQPNDLTVQYFEFIPNTPNGIPQKGDLVIWGTGIGIAGHVAIGTGEGDTNGFTSFDQNWPVGSVCHMQHHDYTGVIGWLRLKVPISPVLVVTGLDEALVMTNIYRALCGIDPTTDEINYKISEYHANKPLSSIIEDIIRGDTRFKNRWSSLFPQPANTSRQNAILAFFKGLGIG